jgi:hypothetical protein
MSSASPFDPPVLPEVPPEVLQAFLEHARAHAKAVETGEMESPYATAGGGCCMYCGTGHSTAVECRPQCTEGSCTWRGVPRQVGDGDQAATTTPLCSRHAPAGAKTLPVPPPPPRASVAAPPS